MSTPAATTSTAMSTSSDRSVSVQPSLAKMQELKPTDLQKGPNRTMPNASLFNFSLPRGHSLGSSKDMPSAAWKDFNNNDNDTVAWIADFWTTLPSSKMQHLRQENDGNGHDDGDTHEPLQERCSRICAQALDIVGKSQSSNSSNSKNNENENNTSRSLYQKDLLLDNLKFVEEALSCLHDDEEEEIEDYDEDLLSQGDMEDLDEHDDDIDDVVLVAEPTATTDASFPLASLVVMDYHQPLKAGPSSFVSPRYNHRLQRQQQHQPQAGNSNDEDADQRRRRRELLLDSMDDMIAAFASSSSSTINGGITEDDLSLGDIESDDEEEDNEEQDDSDLSEGDYEVAQRALSWE